MSRGLVDIKGAKMKKRINTYLVSAISIAALITLAGCGGGDDQVTVPPAASLTAVSGTAAKGIVKRAKVLVCRIVNGAPEPDASCALGATALDGAFNVTLDDGFTGPAVIKVMTNTSSTMLDETTGLEVPYDITMRSVVPAVSAATITYVTPFSEMAASLAGANGNDAVAINLANSQVQQLISLTGADLTIKPVIDLKNSGSDPVLLGKQANIVKQLARLTMTAKKSPDTVDTSGGVRCNTPGTSTSQQLACATEVMSRAMTRGANAAAFALSRIVPAIMSENPTSVTMAIIKPDGTLDLQSADMTSAASMQLAMQNAGMPTAVLVSNVQIMMLQMR